MSKRGYFDWCDYCVSCFVDFNKCLLVFVNDRSETKVINFDSNFYSVEDNIIAYELLLRHSLGIKGRPKEDERKEYERYLRAYVRHIKRQIPKDEELNIEYLEHSGVIL